MIIQNDFDHILHVKPSLKFSIGHSHGGKYTTSTPRDKAEIFNKNFAKLFISCLIFLFLNTSSLCAEHWSYWGWCVGNFEKSGCVQSYLFNWLDGISPRVLKELCSSNCYTMPHLQHAPQDCHSPRRLVQSNEVLCWTALDWQVIWVVLILRNLLSMYLIRLTNFSLLAPTRIIMWHT